MCKLVVTLLLVLTATFNLSAQKLKNEKNIALKKQSDSSSLLHPKQVQLHMGTQGFGLDLKYGISPKFAARIGASSSLSVGVNNVIKLEGLNADNNLTTHFTNVHLIGDFKPFRTNKFRISTGVAYLFEASGNLLFTPTGTYHFDGMELTGEEVGNLIIDLSWKGVAPYLGIGLFKAFPKNIFNVNLDLGTYYLNAPKSKITGTNLLADNYKLEPQLNKNMSSYRFLPILQVNFNMNISKLLR
jgi:hypothetical protein